MVNLHTEFNFPVASMQFQLQAIYTCACLCICMCMYPCFSFLLAVRVAQCRAKFLFNSLRSFLGCSPPLWAPVSLLFCRCKLKGTLYPFSWLLKSPSPFFSLLFFFVSKWHNFLLACSSFPFINKFKVFCAFY